MHECRCVYTLDLYGGVTVQAKLNHFLLAASSFEPLHCPQFAQDQHLASSQTPAAAHISCQMPRLIGTLASHSTSGAHRIWHELRQSHPGANAILRNCNDIYHIRRNSNIAVPERVRRLPAELPFENDGKINPLSLRGTLEAHREANRASLIVKVSEAGKRSSLNIGPNLSNYTKVSSRRRFTPFVKLRIQRDKRKAVLDYEGASRSLTAQWMMEPSSSIKTRMPWWWRRNLLALKPALARHVPASDQLTAEILAFEEYKTPTSDELLAAELAISDLRSCIASIGSPWKVDVIGSRGSGLATPLSDIDLNVAHPDGGNSTGTPLEQKQASKQLAALYAALPKTATYRVASDSFPVYASSFVRQAQVPIIIGEHARTNLKFQIQCTGDCFGSMEHAKAYEQEYPTLRPLYMVLRQMLDIRGLSTGSLGGMGSYPLLIMIVAALKFSEGKVGRREAGKQLIFFMDMYSKIDFYTQGVSLTPLEYVVKHKPTEPLLQRKMGVGPPAPDQGPLISDPASLDKDDLEARKWFSLLNTSEPYLMCLQDPSKPAHDLGRQVKLIKHVQAVFVEASRKLNEAIIGWDTTDWTRNHRAQSNFAMLDWCIGADYGVFEAERGHLSGVGRKSRQPNHGDDHAHQAADAQLHIADYL